MSAPAWFDYQTYFNNKLAQLQELEPTANWTPESLTEAFTTAKYSVTADGMYKHFVDYGNAENISPSPFFDYDEYMANKLAQLQADEPEKGWTPEMVEDAFEAAGLSAWDHYLLYGQAEGISPSASFDTNAYLQAKLDQLTATEPNAGWTLDKVIEAFQANGLNPIEHYVLFGQYEDLSYTPDGPVKPATDTLTVERDVLTLGAGDQIIEGVASALSAENTLNANDNIDGGEGNDTLRVTLDSNFNGFKVTDDPETTGGMKNVENVELINNGSIARTFSAKGSEGVTTYSLTGEGGITVKDLSAAGVTVNVNGMQKDVKVEFTADAVKGDSDSMTFGLKNVGAAAATAKDDDVYLNLTASGVENVSINATGSNFASLKNVTDATSLTVTGSGSLTVDEVASKLTSVDASAAKGNVTIDLSKATSVNSIKGGEGNDTFIVTELAAKAVVEGGAGDDTLIISGSAGTTLQPTMSGFETIGIRDNKGAVTLSAKNAQDFSSLLLENASGASNGSVMVSGLTGSAFTVNSNGFDNKATINKATLFDAVDLTVNVNASADATKAQDVTSTITAEKATNAVINVGENVTEKGSFTLTSAQSVQLNVASSWVDGKEQTTFNGEIVADKAESLIIDADGTLGNTAKFTVNSASSVIIDAARAGSMELNAKSATDVNLTFGSKMTIASGDLSAAQSVTIDQKTGTLTANHASLDLSALSSLTLSGEGVESGKESTVILGALGDAENDYDLTVTATGLAGGFTAGAVASKQDITLDFSQMTGEVKLTSVATSGGDINLTTSADKATSILTKSATGIGASGDINIDVYQGTFSVASGGTAGNIESTAGNINLTFAEAGKDHEIGTLTASGDITLDAFNLMDTVSNNGNALKVGAISAENVTIIGAETAVNDFTTSSITAKTLDFTGGLKGDSVTFEAVSGEAAISATLNTGLGVDKVTVNLHADTDTLTLTGDLGGDTGDSLTFGGAMTGIEKIDLSGLDGYSADIDVSGDFTALTTLNLGGGQETITLESGGSTTLTIDGFTAGQGGDVLHFSGATTASGYGANGLVSVSDFSTVTAEASGAYYYEGTDLATASFNNTTSSDSVLILFRDTDDDTLSYYVCTLQSGVATLSNATASGSVALTGVEGDFIMDNFSFTS